jgi:Tol biopolymer transport system component
MNVIYPYEVNPVFPFVVSIAENGNQLPMTLWNLQTGEQLVQLTYKGVFSDPQFSPDGLSLVINSGGDFLPIYALTIKGYKQ